MTDILLIAVVIEAIVELIFLAGPLQFIRQWIIDRTEFLHVTDYGHLLECKYCASVWIALLIVICYYLIPAKVFHFILLVFVAHRLSNLIHVCASLCRDIQLNIRINRNKGD